MEDLDLTSAQGQFVCGECFDDDGLKAYVTAHASSTLCDFCGANSTNPIAAPLDELVEFMNTCIRRAYDDPANAGVAYDSAEGGYQMRIYNTEEVVRDHLCVDFPNDDDNRLADAIFSPFWDIAWIEVNPYSRTPEDALKYSWDRFSSLIKHETRFFFLRGEAADDDPDILAPAELLDELVSMCNSLGLN